MYRCSRLWPALALSVLLAGCENLNLGNSPDSQTLLPIRYHYISLTDAFDREMVIAPNGELRIRETRGSAASDTRIISSTITEDERKALIAAFKNWKKLEPFYRTDVSPQYAITYGGHTVTTSRLEGMPTNYLEAKGTLDRIIMILVKAANEKAAAAAARAASNTAATQGDPALPTPVVPPADNQ